MRIVTELHADGWWAMLLNHHGDAVECFSRPGKTKVDALTALRDDLTRMSNCAWALSLEASLGGGASGVGDTREAEVPA